MKKNKGLRIFFLLFVVFMFLYPTPAFNGAKNGLLLWFNTILPTLLPFLIVSNIIIQLNITNYVSSFFYPILNKLLHVSRNGSYPVVMGLLSGYPMGAKTCADMVSHNTITKEEGQYLLALTNNASITYLVSYVAISTLHFTSLPYIFVFILYGSSIVSSYIYKKIAHLNWYNLDHRACNSSYNNSSIYNIIDSSIMNGFETITYIGGYIILFSILSHIIVEITNHILILLPEYLYFIFHYITLFIVGSLEITTGTYMTGIDSIPFTIKFLLIVVFSAWGGLSSIAQTYSVIRGTKLSIKGYIIAKIMNTVIAFIISLMYIILLEIL